MKRIIAAALLFVAACGQPQLAAKQVDEQPDPRIDQHEARITELERKAKARESLDRRLVAALSKKDSAAPSPNDQWLEHVKDEETERRLEALER